LAAATCVASGKIAALDGTCYRAFMVDNLALLAAHALLVLAILRSLRTDREQQGSKLKNWRGPAARSPDR
jgi:hypothetical protein